MSVMHMKKLEYMKRLTRIVIMLNIHETMSHTETATSVLEKEKVRRYFQISEKL